MEHEKTVKTVKLPLVGKYGGWEPSIIFSFSSHTFFVLFFSLKKKKIKKQINDNKMIKKSWTKYKKIKKKKEKIETKIK